MVVGNKTIVIKTAEDTVEDMIEAEKMNIRAEGVDLL